MKDNYLRYNYFMDKETGEIVTYSEANKRFYSKKRTYLESIFDEYTETDIESNEKIGMPDFTNVLAEF